MYNIRNCFIRWLMSNSIKDVLDHFSLALIVFRISYNYIITRKFDLNNIDQGHDAQHSQWCHSMVNINVYKCRTAAFFAGYHRFPDIKCYTISRNVDLENIDQGHDVQHLQWCYSMANFNVYKKTY